MIAHRVLKDERLARGAQGLFVKPDGRQVQTSVDAGAASSATMRYAISGTSSNCR